MSNIGGGAQRRLKQTAWLQDHGEGEGAEGDVPPPAQSAEAKIICFKHSFSNIENNINSIYQLAACYFCSIPQACLINTELEIWGTDNGHKTLGGHLPPVPRCFLRLCEPSLPKARVSMNYGYTIMDPLI